MVERQQLQRHLLIEAVHVIAVAVGFQHLQGSVRGQQVQVAEMRVVGGADPFRPLAQLGERLGVRLVAQEITRRRRMVHKAFHGRFGFLFELRARNDQFDAGRLRRIQRPLHRIGIGVTGKTVCDPGFLHFAETFERRTVGRDAVPSQDRHFAGRLQFRPDSLFRHLLLSGITTSGQTGSQ